MSTRLKALVVLAAGAMLITACGSSDGGDRGAVRERKRGR